MGRRTWKHQNDNWNTIVNRHDFRKEKAFNNREIRLRNATSFFISNLPESCSRESLWRSFQHLSNLEDVFVPFKTDRAGGRFGFVKLSNIKDPDWWIEKLKEVRIDGAVIGVSLAKFNRDGSKVVDNKMGDRPSVFSRLKENCERVSVFDRIQEPGTEVQNSNPVVGHNWGRSFREVVQNSSWKGTKNPEVMVIPPSTTEMVKNNELKSLVGEAKDIDTLNNLNNFLEEGLRLSYLGGLKVLIHFNSAMEAEDYLRKEVESWEKWFSRLYVWEGIPPIFERVAWIKILGVPASLWENNIFNRIGERCGRLLVKSEASSEDGNLSEERVAILVNSGRRISDELVLSWKDHKINIWVEEISGQWVPDFLSNSDKEDAEGSTFFSDDSVAESKESSADSDEVYIRAGEESPGISPEYGKCNSQVNGNSKGRRETTRSTCMGNINLDDGINTGCNNDCEVQESAEKLEELVNDVRSEKDNAFMEEREDRDQVDPNKRLGELSEDGCDEDNGPDPPRPSFITLRHNQFKPKRNDGAQEFVTPDLNKAVGVETSSDPFNIEEIFRLEAASKTRDEANSSMRIRGETESDEISKANGDTGVNREVDLGVDREVAETLEVGIALGIDVNGFENHVRKLVNGESARMGDQ
ncbi:putative RNA recognition motif domain, nucleotide-binding alpha-beta plait domain superfamily [Helianthus anomalus]